MHGISSGQLCTWRRQFRSGESTGFMPVSIAPEPSALPASAAVAPVAPVAAPALGTIKVELPSGVKLRVSGDVEADNQFAAEPTSTGDGLTVKPVA
jgi:transposase